MAGEASNSKETCMRGIIVEQFGAEIAFKEGELSQIEDRIRLAKLMLQRLRMGVMAQHYGSAGFYPTELDYSQENIGAQGSWDTFEQAALEKPEEPEDEACDEDSKESTSPKSVSIDDEKNPEPVNAKEEPMEVNGEVEDHHDPVVTADERVQPICTREDIPSKSHDLALKSHDPAPKPHDPTVQLHDKMLYERTAPSCDQTTGSCDLESRFYRKKRVIVGNTSQYLDPSSQCGGSTHKWMAYVRGSQAEPDISHFVKAVRFFLHPSYRPHDIIVIGKAPFHLTKLGWGEFPIRVQLEFMDGYNKPVDIIHNLVLDRTHTGHQTLGAETVVDLDLSVPREIGGPSLEKQSKDNGHAPNGMNPPLVNGLDDNLDISEMKEISTTQPNAEATEPLNEVVLEDEIKLTEEDHMEVSETPEKEPLAARCCEYVPKSQRGHKPDAPIIIRHISLPLESIKDSVCLDHDYCSTIVTLHSPHTQTPSVSRESSVATSDNSRLKSEPSPPQVLTTNLDKCLHAAVRSIPLYGRASPNEGFLLPASSLTQFQGWPVGRRRASEWMRAVAVRHHVERQLRIPAVMTTKQVVQWCRRNGYTPLDVITPMPDSGFCKCCGCQLRPQQDEEGCSVVTNIHETCSQQLKQTDHSSLTTPYSCFADVLSIRKEIRRQEEHREMNQELDIVTVSKPETTTIQHTVSEDTSLPRFRIPQTPELKWIQQTAASIGIRVYPAVIDRMYAHVVEHMIYMSCARFLRSILVQATQEAGLHIEGELCQERILTPQHVHQALCNLESCDFVTGKYLGVDGGGGPESDSESTSSGSDSD